eukprot:jgi/Orpsp1_1/1177734/evm.model.c7180000062623.1
MIYFNFINLLYILIYLLLIINSKTITNEDEFRTILSSGSKEIEINVENKIDLNDHINIYESYNKISIIGNSGENSILNFINPYGQIYFGENVADIEFLNISINGNINFNNNKRITLKNSSLTGYIYSNFEKSNEYIKLTNFSYKTSNVQSYHCINLGGNIEIENSEFYGSSLCQNRLFDYTGLDKYKINITNSYFSGGYSCPCINIINSVNVNIENSTFEKAYTKPNISG